MTVLNRRIFADKICMFYFDCNSLYANVGSNTFRLFLISVLDSSRSSTINLDKVPGLCNEVLDEIYKVADKEKAGKITNNPFKDYDSLRDYLEKICSKRNLILREIEGYNY